MIVHELTRDECDGVLSRMHIARLACARHGQPYVVPVSFVFDSSERSLVGFSMVGQKIEWMRQNPKVCVEVDEIVDDVHWKTVIVNGIYQEISTGHGAQLARAQQLLQKRAAWWLPGTAKPAHGVEHTTPLFYRVSIRSVSGRRTSVTPR
jgi:nitroimidazol reductase NimA-like FMN-containing flavoprotein (pyridoxamine 5'-phosphate oxidase superfamily)